MNDISLIKVTRNKGKDKQLVVHNPTKYPLIGKGKQGAVFKLSEEHCVKIFLKSKDVKLEKEVMIKFQNFSFMPKFFECGPNYIIMEYIKGTSLLEYLTKQGKINESITKQLVSMIKEMKCLGITNLDRHIGRHILVNNHQVLKVIDHASSFERKPIPVRLLCTLAKLDLIKIFLQQVKTLDSKLYNEWNNYINNLASKK